MSRHWLSIEIVSKSCKDRTWNSLIVHPTRVHVDSLHFLLHWYQYRVNILLRLSMWFWVVKCLAGELFWTHTVARAKTYNIKYLPRFVLLTNGYVCGSIPYWKFKTQTFTIVGGWVSVSAATKEAADLGGNSQHAWLPVRRCRLRPDAASALSDDNKHAEKKQSA